MEERAVIYDGANESLKTGGPEARTASTGHLLAA